MKKKENLYVILDEVDYADEFGYPIFSVFTKKERSFILNNLNKLPEEVDLYFGTNEFLSFDKDEIKTLFSDARKISKKELKVLTSFNIFEMGLDIHDRVLSEITYDD